MQKQKTNFSPGKVIIEGKTKIVSELPNDKEKVILSAKDDITAFNKQKHDIVEGKARIATQTTCNVFRLLKACGLPVAFEKQIDETSFVAPYCDMILYEVVARREAHGSFLKRRPYLKKGHVFPELIVEFFLKTANATWNNATIPADDPYIVIKDKKGSLYIPNKPLWEQEPFLELSDYPLAGKEDLFDQIETLTRQAFYALESAWFNAGSKLVDFKLEFGIDRQGNLLIADVIDNDSWRVVHDDTYLDKQAYRDGQQIDEVMKKYRYVEQKTGQFSVPKQQIIIWRGSPKDEVDDLVELIKTYHCDSITTTVITCSMHKDPISGYQQLIDTIQTIPHSVVIAFVGRSNGAGPILSAHTTVPVITVPAGWEKRPEDIWSSLRAPSKTPVMTVLDKANAVLAALQILSQQNPQLYMQLHTERIGRLRNIISL